MCLDPCNKVRRMYDTSEYSISDLAEMFTVSRPTVYRTLARTKVS
ncbi:helix-turn-helix domain-containing protein [Pseudovibrio sp. Tun.PSC04-5.I4]|nr:helix-turn-helix domain-containing protein [Pseudovibrio sp. Tun.PSC04-5.I4]